MDPYDKRYSIERDASVGSFNLAIVETQLQDAGAYVCHDSESNNSTTAQLIVLGKDPICQSNIKPIGFIGPNDCGLEHETIRLSCSISYKGNVPPEFQFIRVKGQNVFSMEEYLPRCLVSGIEGRLTCTYEVVSYIELDESYFSCQTKRTRNVHYSCSSNVVKILYATGNKNPIAKAVGDTEICSAKASSHDCSYKWIWSDGNNEEIVSESAILTINRDGRHECAAKCSLKDIDCQFKAMFVNAFTANSVEAPQQLSTSVGWALGVALFISLCAIVTMALIICRRNRKTKEKSPPGYYKEENVPLRSFVAEEKLHESMRTLLKKRMTLSAEPIAEEKVYHRTEAQVEKRLEFIFENLAYTREHEHLKTIQTTANPVISGITLLNRKLYVVHEYCSTIEVYDCDSMLIDSEKTLRMESFLANPLDIASSDSSQILFVADLANSLSQCRIKTMDVNGIVLNHWFVVDNECRLSVYKSNVIACLPNKNQVIEYSPQGDEFSRVILSPKDGFDKLLHAVKVSGTKFAVSHKVSNSDEPRVTIVQTYEKSDLKTNHTSSAVIVYSTSPLVCGLIKPICLVRDSETIILVADKMNNHVLAIDVENNVCEVLIRDGRIKNLLSICKMDHHPIRMCLESSSGMLFVALGGANLKSGIISTFKRQVPDQKSKPDVPNDFLVPHNLSYMMEPKHLETFPTRMAGAVISGMTLLSQKLYVAHELCSNIDVYGYKMTTFEYQETLNTKNSLTNPLDLASSEMSKCLYVVDMQNNKDQCWIRQLDIKGKVLIFWPINNNECRLSVYQSNVIACLPNKNQIIEFTPQGKVVFKVTLSPIDGFEKLWHAIKINDSKYAVSHKVSQSDEHRVTIIEKNGLTEMMANEGDSVKILYATSPTTCGLNFPICLAHDRKERILVAENLNNRVVLIDPASDTCEVLLRDGRLKNLRSHCTILLHPIRMCLDESNGRLIVAKGGSHLINGIISIFMMQETV